MKLDPRIYPTTFSDGAPFRIEIPSVEGPRVMAAVLHEAQERNVPVRRISQGSGVMMLTDSEISEMVTLGAAAGVEVCLFLGPRGGWDTGGQSFVSTSVAGSARGDSAVAWCVREATRATRLGVRSLLVSDIGVLRTLSELRTAGDLPRDLILKTSVLIPCANAASARVLAESGADSINVSTDIDSTTMGEIRGAVSVPLDVYIEVPEDQGGFVRYYEAAEVVYKSGPVYLKLGLRNAPNIYPSGQHLGDLPERLGVERVRRAELMLRLIEEEAPELVEKCRVEPGHDLGVPIVP